MASTSCLMIIWSNGVLELFEGSDFGFKDRQNI